MSEFPFDRTLPSPLAPIAALLAPSEASVVASAGPTPQQDAMFVSTAADEALLAEVTGPNAWRLVVLTGSAGSGKSASICRLLAAAGDAFSHVVLDATHAESPTQDQVRTLADCLGGFRAGVPGPGERTLLAANTGLLLRFRERLIDDHEDGLVELVTHVLWLAGVPGLLPLPVTRAADLTASVLVVDLDQRPTSGGPEELFARMLGALDPAAPGGLLGGAVRCETCQVRQWCAPRANLELLARDETIAAIDALVDAAAYRRGRDHSPRTLWNFASRLVLGTGDLASPADPCEAVAELAARGDAVERWRGFLPNTLEVASVVLDADFARLDPTFRPAARWHDLMARAAVDPAETAATMLQLAGPVPPDAIRAAARDLENEAPTDLARTIARFDWLAAGGDVLAASATGTFERALQNEDEAVSELLAHIGEGLAAAFGVRSEGSTYMPTENLPKATAKRVFAHVDLDGELDLKPLVALARNDKGRSIVAARPRRARLILGPSSLEFDLPLLELLEAAAGGAEPATVDVERFHALRHAVEQLGRHAASASNTPLVIADAATGSLHRVARVQRRGQVQITVSRVA